MRRGRRKNTLRLGDSNAIDDITGFKEKRSDLVKLSGTQKGLLTHRRNWNPAHPQLFIRGRDEKVSVDDSRVRQPDVFDAVPQVLNWILVDGQWDDSKLWQDGNIWLDTNPY
tara:strand:- start:5792 stop:6127 length:336 start_codon:yes stop_codon:yes gene_type:complete